MKFTGFLPAVLWLALCTALLCMPGSAIPMHPFLAAIQADKWVHIALFGVLCFLFFFPLLKYRLQQPVSPVWFWMIILAGTIYGTLMEFVQKYWVVNRSFDVWDIVADGAGCILAYLFCRIPWFRRVLKKIGPDRNRDRNQN